MAGKKDIVEQALKYLGDYFEPSVLEGASSLSPKSRERTVYMSPDEFLRLARPLDAPQADKLEALRQSLDRGEKLRSAPYLGFDHEGDEAQITGHEGRHRALVLKERGVEQMPVNVKSSRIRWSEQSDPNRYDYITDWPKTLKSETGNVEVPFPFDRPKQAYGGRVGYGPGGVIDDIVKMAGKIVSGAEEPATTSIRAYHGSPHDFDRFDMSKIGTGEGAQAYGHGLYFAESEPVALGYRRALSGPESMGTVTFDGRPLVSKGSPAEGWDDPELYLSEGIHARDLAETMLRHSGDVDAAVAELRSKSQSGLERAQTVKNEKLRQVAASGAKTASDMADFLQANANRYGVKVPGHMYEVNIAADPNTFLDWDKPLPLNHPLRDTIADAAMKASGSTWSQARNAGRDAMVAARNENLTGEGAYRQLSKMFETSDDAWQSISKTPNELVNTKAAASEALKQAGIPGIKYLDAGSRSAGEGTRNYVVFDDRLISIIRKYGIAGASAMLGYNLMEQLDPKQALAASMADQEYQAAGKAEGGSVGDKDPYAEEIAKAKALMAAKAYEDQSWSDWAGDVAQNAVNTAKAILPTALGGEGRVGISDMARGAYEAGKDAATFPGDVITGKQALYDEAGMPLEQAVGRSFNTAGTIGGASSVVPVPDNSLRIFGGIKSLTADKPAIRQAMAMESKGASPDEVYFQTGWFRGADGFWRYEIPDIDATIDPSKLQMDLSSAEIPTPYKTTLGEYLNHPEFFAAYPQFKNMSVSTFSNNPGYGGFYYPRRDAGIKGIIDPRITLNQDILSNAANQRSVLLHEAQHAVQQKEGFAPGTNIEAQGAGRVAPEYKRFMEAVKNDSDMRRLMDVRSSVEYKMQKDAANDLYYRKYKPIEEQIELSGKSSLEKAVDFHRYQKQYEDEEKELFPLIAEVSRLSDALGKKNIPLYKPQQYYTPEQSYSHFAGEVEARNVQGRRDLDRETLRQFSPWATQEYPYINQIFPENDVSWKLGYADGGEVDDDIHDAVRVAKQVGGVLMEDAKGNKYDAQGNIIPPTQTGPNFARSEMTPAEVGRKAAMDPATYDALMERYAVPDRDILDYEATKKAVEAQPYETRQMTHVGDRPTREVTVDMPLFGGEYGLGQAPYDVAGGMSGMAQTAYDLKTAPFYAFPLTAPLAAGMDVAEGVATNDPLTASLAVGFGPGSKYAKAAGVGAVNYLMDPSEAEAGPERWFSKALEVARNIPMNKMTGEQALAMLRKGTSPEELKWIGADRFLPGQERMTKQDLIDYLEKNRVGTEDVVMGGSEKPTSYSQIQTFDDDIRAKFDPEIERLINQRNAMYEERKGLVDADGNISLDNYSRFQQLRRREQDADDTISRLELSMRQEQANRMGGLGSAPKFQGYSTPGGEGYRETLITLPTKEYGTLYKSRHWEDVPNVVGHIRTQMLTANPPGANRPYKLFNVDEAQSDWGKSGRDEGFSDPIAINELKASEKKLQDLQSKIGAENHRLRTEYNNQIAPFIEKRRAFEDDLIAKFRAGEISRGEMSRLSDEFEASLQDGIKPYGQKYRQAVDSLVKPMVDEMTGLQQKISVLSGKTGKIATAPYVTSTQNWTDLSIKKALDQAIDSGADYFTFTPGEVQAERYDLSKHIGKVEYNPDDGSLMAYDPKGKMVINESVSDPSELDEYVGRELGDKIRAESSSRESEIDDAYEVFRDEENDGWTLSMYGDPVYDRYGDPMVFGSRGEANDYLRELKANDYGNNPISIAGLDLKTGGEGMIDYYNNIYKKRVEKVVKDATGKKVQWEVVPAETSEGIVPRLGFRIDDDIKGAKFSTFARGGVVRNDNLVSKALALTSEV